MLTPMSIGPAPQRVSENVTIGRNVLKAFTFGTDDIKVDYMRFIRRMSQLGVSTAGSNEALGILGIKMDSQGILVQH